MWFLHHREEVQFGELMGFIATVFICRDDKEKCIWKSSTSGKFSTKAFIWLCWVCWVRFCLGCCLGGTDSTSHGGFLLVGDSRECVKG